MEAGHLSIAYAGFHGVSGRAQVNNIYLVESNIFKLYVGATFRPHGLVAGGIFCFPLQTHVSFPPRLNRVLVNDLKQVWDLEIISKEILFREGT